MAGRTRGEDRTRQKLEAELDRALAQTFPASDPFSVGQFTSTEPPSRSTDYKPPKIEAAPRARRKRK